jgi:site-specific recombinase XerD
MVELESTGESEDTSQAGPVGALVRRTVETVKVYTRHKRTCPKRDRPDWARCNCVKWLYVYRDGKCKLTSAKTRSWERAEQKARELRDSFDATKQLQRQLEARINVRKGQVEIALAVEQFFKEVARLNREEATRAKYNLTLTRLLTWCATQEPAILLLSQLDVPTLRSWIHSWTGAPTTRHNQHQRLRTFFRFCMEQGWITENPAKRIKNVAPHQEQTLPFSRQQYDALIEATYYYDSRGKKKNGNTTNSRRTRAYLKLLRWSGLRAGDAACLPKSNLRDDDSLFLYQAKVKSKASAPVQVLLPHSVADELRKVPPGSCTDPNYFFWSGRSKRKSEVSNWQKIFSKILSRAVEMLPKLFLDANGRQKPAHLHMMRDTFAVEYLLARARFADLCQYFSQQNIDLPAQIVEEVRSVSKLAVEDRIARMKRLNQELMEYLHAAGLGPHIRQ